MYRIVATDLDGTLVRSDGTVSRRTLSALKIAEAAGALIVFVTGRSLRSVRPIVAMTGHRGFVVCCNGAVVYETVQERVVEEYCIATDQAGKIVATLCRVLPGIRVAAERGGRHPVAKLVCTYKGMNADQLLEAVRPLIGESVTVAHGGAGLVEITATGVTKAAALSRLCSARGVPPAEVAAFGDMPNDIAMLQWAGRSVAVANAHDAVKVVADLVTASNDEDGVAMVLEKAFGCHA